MYNVLSFVNYSRASSYIYMNGLLNGQFGARKLACYTEVGILYVEVIAYSKECNWYTRLYFA